MPDQMKLTEISDEAFALPAAYEKIWKILYAVDPALLRRFKDDRLIEIARVNIDYRIQVAQAELEGLNAQIAVKKAEIEALSKMMEVVR